MTRYARAALPLLFLFSLMISACATIGGNTSQDALQYVHGTFPSEILGYKLFPLFRSNPVLGHSSRDPDAGDFREKLWDGDPENEEPDQKKDVKDDKYILNFNSENSGEVWTRLKGVNFDMGGARKETLQIVINGLKVKKLKDPFPIEDPKTNPNVKANKFIDSLLWADEIIIQSASDKSMHSDISFLGLTGEQGYKIRGGKLQVAQNRFIGYRLTDWRELTRRYYKEPVWSPGKKEVLRVFIAEQKLCICDGASSMMSGRLVANLDELFRGMGCVVLKNEEDAKYVVSTSVRQINDNISHLSVRVTNRLSRSSVFSLDRDLVEDEPGSIEELQTKLIHGFAENIKHKLDKNARERVSTIARQVLVGSYRDGMFNKVTTRQDKNNVLKGMVDAEQLAKAGGLENYKKAREILDHLLGIDPDYIPALQLLADVYIKLFKYRQAIDCLKDLSRLAKKNRDKPMLGECLMKWGDIYRMKGDYEGALDKTQEAFNTFQSDDCFGKKHPETAMCKLQLGILQRSIADSNRDTGLSGEADESIQGGIEGVSQFYGPSNTEMLDAYRMHGTSLSLGKKNFEAIDSLVISLKLNEKIDPLSLGTADSCNRLGVSLIGLGQLDSSIDYLTRGLDIFTEMKKAGNKELQTTDPRPVVNYIALAVAHGRKNEKKANSEDLKKQGEYYSEAGKILSEINGIAEADKKKQFFNEILPVYGAEGFRDLTGYLVSFKKIGAGVFSAFVALIRNAVDTNWISLKTAMGKESKVKRELFTDTDAAGKKFHICRIQDETGATVAIGNTVDGGESCQAVKDAESFTDGENIEMLAFHGVGWGTDKSSDLAGNPHVAGLDKDGIPIYMCRVKDGAHAFIGRVLQDTGSCAYASGSSTKYSEVYDILVDK